ncbi:MAG: DNA repair protein RecN [Bacteroidales bacterium]|nr:DNA repair protein RecN [Bacteroidales bacterium]
MLQALQIENYAIIRSLKINFDQGFTVITGETGAGKSIIIGALSLILGQRADTSVLHDKNRKCFIEGTFDLSQLKLQEFFQQHDLDYQDISYIRREVTENGKSRAFINDTPVTLTVLKELAESLVDIHSQHNNLLVNHENFRINVLDLYSQNQQLLEKYRKTYNEYRKTEKRWLELAENQRKQAQERSYMEYVCQELSEAKLTAGEQEQLERRISLLSHAETIKAKLYQSLQLLAEDEEDNLLRRLQVIHDNCQNISSFDQDVVELSQRLGSCLLELKDIADDLSQRERKIEVNPQELEQLNERLDQLLGLEHKHHVNNDTELVNLLEDTRTRLAAMTENDEQLEQCKKQCEELYAQTVELAGQLSQSRRQCCDSLEQEMVSRMRLLGMEHGNFKVEISQQETPGANGIDKIQFLFSANRGGQLQEIEKTASGGEISRLMLALKSIINDNSLLPTVVFDEIDAGISGEVAGKVASLMQSLSLKHQLVVITHLPQIAAKGNMHYFVYKSVADDQTFTQIKSLNKEESIREIATMISGDHVSEAALKTAKELKTNTLS